MNEDEELSGSAQWVEEDTERQAELESQGYEPTKIRRWVQDSFWAVLMFKED